MKFPVDKCWDCGLDLTTAEPAEVSYSGEMAVGTCPGCLRTYFMSEVTPPEPEASETEPVVEPEAPAVEEAAPAEAPEPETPGEEKKGG